MWGKCEASSALAARNRTARRQGEWSWRRRPTWAKWMSSVRLFQCVRPKHWLPSSGTFGPCSCSSAAVRQVHCNLNPRSLMASAWPESCVISGMMKQWAIVTKIYETSHAHTHTHVCIGYCEFLCQFKWALSTSIKQSCIYFSFSLTRRKSLECSGGDLWYKSVISYMRTSMIRKLRGGRGKGGRKKAREGADEGERLSAFCADLWVSCAGDNKQRLVTQSL